MTRNSIHRMYSHSFNNNPSSEGFLSFTNVYMHYVGNNCGTEMIYVSYFVKIQK